MKLITTLLFGLLLAAPATAAENCPELLRHTMKKLHSSDTVDLCATFGGKPLLVVNTASFCGFTKQFKGLEALHQQYGPRGIGVLGVPSDSFRQEADDEAETADVCYVNYGVTFTMVAPVPVRGDEVHPLFAELARQSEAPGWNFNKYVVDADGKVLAHFGATTAPDDEELTGLLESLAQPAP